MINLSEISTEDLQEELDRRNEPVFITCQCGMETKCSFCPKMGMYCGWSKRNKDGLKTALTYRAHGCYEHYHLLGNK